MESTVPPFSKEQKEQYRRSFEAFGEHNRRQREWKRREPVNPEESRRVGEAHRRAVRERSTDIEGDTASDDEVEARVARALFALGTHRVGGEGA